MNTEQGGLYILFYLIGGGGFPNKLFFMARGSLGDLNGRRDTYLATLVYRTKNIYIIKIKVLRKRGNV